MYVSIDIFSDFGFLYTTYINIIELEIFTKLYFLYFISQTSNIIACYGKIFEHHLLLYTNPSDVKISMKQGESPTLLITYTSVIHMTQACFLSTETVYLGVICTMLYIK